MKRRAEDQGGARCSKLLCGDVQKELRPFEALPAYSSLSPAQRAIIRRVVAMLDSERDSVVISNPLEPASPIVYVTSAWQSMCGFSAQQAVGANPRLTQGMGTCQATLQSMRGALREQRACKVRLVNYKGATGEPFWNCLSVQPIFYERKLLLFAARLEDYTYRLNKLISAQPVQFCKSETHFQCRLNLLALTSAQGLARPALLEVRDGALDRVDESGSGAETAWEEQTTSLQLPTQFVRRLGWSKLTLTPEYLADRILDECAQLNMPCRVTEQQIGDGEVVRLEVFCGEPSRADGVHALLHVMPESVEGVYGVSVTRLQGDTFLFHDLYRKLRSRLSDITLGPDALLPASEPASKLA